MTTLHSLIDSVKRGWRPPNVIALRCVHSRLEVASCSKCVESCPRRAWVIDDEQLGLDVDACDGCGLCAAACTEAAIVQPLVLETRAYEGEAIVFAACEFAGVAIDNGSIPCLHAITTLELIQLYQRGVRRLLLAKGDCATCVRGKGTLLSHRINEFNRLLEDRGMAVLTTMTVTPRRWTGVLHAAKQVDDRNETMDRRDFFRNMAKVVARQHDEIADESGAFAVSPGRLFPRQKFSGLAFFAPDIDVIRCVGCDACVRVCEYGAIRLAVTGDCYELDADGCTGCGLCIDVCETNAVSVGAWGRQRKSNVPLGQYCCSACGVEFHQPIESSEFEPTVCRICAVTGHINRLHQVLE